MVRLDRAISGNTMNGVMARSSRTMTFKGPCHRSMARLVRITAPGVKPVDDVGAQARPTLRILLDIA
jgi:hypothetical protein